MTLTIIILVASILPAIIALIRRKVGAAAVVSLNIVGAGAMFFGLVYSHLYDSSGGFMIFFLGLIGLLLCFVWACTGTTKRDEARAAEAG